MTTGEKEMGDFFQLRALFVFLWAVVLVNDVAFLNRFILFYSLLAATL